MKNKEQGGKNDNPFRIHSINNFGNNYQYYFRSQKAMITRFVDFFFRIRDETSSHEEKMIDYEIVVRQKFAHIEYELPIEDITIDHQQKKVYIWVD